MIAEYEAERTNKALNAPRPYGLALHHKHLPEMAAVTGAGHRTGILSPLWPTTTRAWRR